MRRVISEQDRTILGDLDRLIANVNNSNMRESAPLLHMAKLDMHTRIYGISEGELRELSSVVEDALLSRRAVHKAAKCAYPRRRCERPAMPRSVGKS
jgi:hypothetical protein